MKLTTTFDLSDGGWLRHGALGGAALGAIVLLAIFYSVVIGAVERGASRRADLGGRSSVATAAATTSSSRPIKIARFDE